MSSPYDDLKRVLGKDSDERILAELEPLEEWFRKRSKVFEKLPRETLLQLMKQCQFRKVEKNDVISQQGDVDNGFFLILRGKVSVQLMPAIDLEDRDDSVSRRDVVEESDTAKIGTVINKLGDGDTFGELSLVSEDYIQNAAYVAEQDTDVIVLERTIYKELLSDFINPDFQDRLAFVDSFPLFSTWPNKWKKYVAASLCQQHHNFEEVLAKQGEKADYMYFIISGEVSIVVDPVPHEEQFAEFRSKCSHLIDDTANRKSTNFSMVNWLSAKSRVADRLKSANRSGNAVSTDHSFKEDHPEFRVTLLPSAIRKKTALERHKIRKMNLCYLSKGNIIGDVEFILDMELYHATATCTQKTITMSLHRAVYERIFVKKNPKTFKQMCRNLERQIPIRYSRKQVVDAVPLIQYIVAKIRDMNGSPKIVKEADDTESLPFLDSSSHAGSRSSRAKSGISARSFPMTRRSEDRFMTPKPALPSFGEPTMSSGYLVSPRGMTAMRRSDGAMGSVEQLNRSTVNPERLDDDDPKTANHVSGSDNPRDGIFIKLLQISNPMVSRRHLNVDADEYNYLRQLRRRMARTIEDFYPTAAVTLSHIPGGRASRAHGSDRRTGRATTARMGALPVVPGTSRASPHKTAMKRKSAKSRPNTRQKSVFFTLP